MIRKTRKHLTKKSLFDLCYAFMFPYLIYCIDIWGNEANIRIDPLFKIQKRIVRLIYFSEYLVHTEPLCQTFGYITHSQSDCLSNCSINAHNCIWFRFLPVKYGTNTIMFFSYRGLVIWN